MRFPLVFRKTNEMIHDHLNQELEESKKRMVEVEKAFEKTNGIKIRNDITEVHVDFTKVELLVMHAGLSKYMKDSKNGDDIRFAVDLQDKIMKHMNDIKEDVDGQ